MSPSTGAKIELPVTGLACVFHMSTACAALVAAPAAIASFESA